jgi:preprotein translocase subunit SecD
MDAARRDHEAAPLKRKTSDRTKMSIIVAFLLSVGSLTTQAASQPAKEPLRALAIHRAENETRPGLEAVKASYGQVFWMHRDPDLDERDVQRVEFIEDPDGLPAIKITFTPEGTVRFRRLTREHLKRRLIFFVQGRFVMDPVVTAEAKSDFTLIQGHVTEADAKTLAAAIKKKN